jgi:hypothetical protein
MIKAFLIFPGRKVRMPALQSKKEESHDTLCEELLRERAAVLSRAGNAVEDALAELTRVDDEIRIKNLYLKSFKRRKHKPDYRQNQQVLIDEINMSIDQFNDIHKRAQLKYYYLIVTREALGLRRHDMIQEIYRIPAKKKKVKEY